MIPALSDPDARRLWDAYFSDVERLLKRAGPDAATLRDDLAEHMRDSMASIPAGSERERLEVAISRLGRPIDYLRPLLADELIERGTRTYNPVVTARGLGHAVLAGSRRAIVAGVFGLGYLLLAVFAAMVVLKPLWGRHVGLFRYPDGSLSFGIVAASDGARELLGWWSMPIAFLMAILLYVVLSRGLRSVVKRCRTLVR